MKYLIDTSPRKMQTLAGRELVAGQLCTPLTNYRNWGGTFAIDNGAFSGLNRTAWFRLLEKHLPLLDDCQFVTIPDIVGNCKRTLELFDVITQDARTHPYRDRWSFVMQDGIEDTRIQWNRIPHIFIGGTDAFKDSQACYDIVKTAKALAIPVHVGRVNQIKRFRTYHELGADTCDGSSIAMYDYKLRDIEAAMTNPVPTTPLFESLANDRS